MFSFIKGSYKNIHQLLNTNLPKNVSLSLSCTLLIFWITQNCNYYYSLSMKQS